MTKWNAICSKINVRATLEKGTAPNGHAMVKVHIHNGHLKYPIKLVHLLWINLYENKIVKMSETFEKIALASSEFIKCVDFAFEPMRKNRLFWEFDFIGYFTAESTNVCVPVNKFDLSKDYKLVIYYGPLELLFSKEFVIKVSEIFSFLVCYIFELEICLTILDVFLQFR